ncbi:DUF4340 domain-containing protein [Beggiatoa leptomitoformis]|uniref:DUF4340 domain-containing protein n=1 Tax=Beggiatoa leptomitoformis TaxID=288004 RepID=A0A2N9YD67_9GAMM|nr:DUF4340 domain-containing protein [Beggiatoa leptomitoformis]ALG69139.1 DUF4340 domain-containing protein [Beggiatoa leptomitoformis]AUI68443.1 DUF4340 domain-containing protein [Beggiatoa leptomitoformis]
MRQRWLFILTLFTLIMGLGSITFFTTTTDLPTHEKQHLTTLDPKKVQHIRLERLNKETVVFTKDTQGIWYVQEPFQLPANRFRVENILTLLYSTQFSLLTSDNINLAELKLDPPLVKVTYDDFPIQLGLVSPFNDGRRYALVNGKVYLLLDTIYRFLTDEAALAVSLFPLGDSADIIELRLPTLHLKQQEGIWKLQHTDTVGISTDDLTALVENWQHLQAISVGRYQEKPVLAIIEVITSTHTFHFELQATYPEFILGLPEKGILYYLPPTQAKTLLGKTETGK